MYQQNYSTTLPRGFRFHQNEPKTPEPAPESVELRQPSPPRQRLRVRRRNAGSMDAPTGTSLASIIAADIPILSIEEPEPSNAEIDLNMPDREPIPNRVADRLFIDPPQLRIDMPSNPPKTPVPKNDSFDAVSQRPNWKSGAVTPDIYTRPTSAMSITSDSSDDSVYYGYSRPSEDGSCTSPDSDYSDPFQLPGLCPPGKGKEACSERSPYDVRANVLNAKSKSKSSKHAPWTKPMENHLTATLIKYIQDPTVTPFRVSAKCMPPEGVCHRVAREAKRSWKGPQLRRSSRLNVNGDRSEKSGSTTPTIDLSSSAHAPWPHSLAATRVHLREIWKREGAAIARHQYLQSRSPTPFSKVEETPCNAKSNVSTGDLAVSLATSTAESMQPDGPLASLASKQRSESPALNEFNLLNFGDINVEDKDATIRSSKSSRTNRLGSPIFACTYGPSSSKNVSRHRPSLSRSHNGTFKSDGPKLASPVRFEARSLNGTFKRRAQMALDEEMSPSGAVLRPTILNEKLYGMSFKSNARRCRTRGFSLNEESLNRNRNVFQPRPMRLTLPIQPEVDADGKLEMNSPKLLPSATFEAPPRLGSPFRAEGGSSNTFPRRLFQDGTATIRRSGYTSLHQSRRSIESFSFGEGRSLHSRLSQLDQKLAEIRDREPVPKK